MFGAGYVASIITRQAIPANLRPDAINSAGGCHTDFAVKSGTT